MRFLDDVFGVRVGDGQQDCFEEGDIEEVPVDVALELVRDRKAVFCE